MGSYPNDVGVLVPKVLLPPKGTDFEKWAVVACDQYTSQPEYWERVREIAGDEPTTLDLILPEAFLGQPDEAERIAAIRENMEAYLRLGVLEEQPQGFYMLPERIDRLKENDLWTETRQTYLRKKNTNENPDKHSRSLFAEAVNETYRKFLD